MRSARGFTLIELIISLTIVAMVAIVLFAALSAALRAWNRGSDRIGDSVRTRIGMDLIRKQMGCISQVLNRVEMPGGVPGQPLPFFRGDSRHVEFISLSGLLFQENPGLVIVTYSLESQGGRQFLAERERRYLGVDSLAQPMADSAPIPIIEDVADVQFRFLEKIEDPPMSGNIIYNWVDMWICDADFRNELPQAIELDVRMLRPGASYGVTSAPQDLRIVVPVITKPVQQGFGRRTPFDPKNPRLPGNRGLQGGTGGFTPKR